MIGNPSTYDFEKITCANIMMKCPITTASMKNAYNIFGSDQQEREVSP